MTLFALALLVSSSAPAAAPPAWQRVAPNGGSIRCLAASPETPVVYAATPGGGFRSADGGRSWTPIPASGDAGFPSVFAVRPGHPDSLLAVAPAPLVSTDGGATWRRISLPRSSGDAVAFDLAQTDVAYVKSGTMLWQVRLSPSLEPIAASELAVAPTSPPVVVAGPRSGVWVAAGDRLFRSTSGGDVWTSTAPVAPSAKVVSAGVDAEGNVLAATEAGTLYLSGDGGETWTSSFLAQDPSSLRVPNGTGRTHLLADGRLYARLESEWTDLALPEPVTHAVSVGASPGATLIGVAWSGAMRSEDGLAFSAANAGLSGMDLVDAAAAPGVSGPLLAAAADGTLYRAAEGGSFVRVTLPPPTGSGVRLAWVRGGTFLWGRSDGLWRSLDSGASWSYAHPYGPVGFAPAGSVTWATYGTGTIRSTDDGATWRPTDPTGPVKPGNPVPMRYVAASPADYRRAVVVSDKLYLSTDSGESWSGRALPPVSALLADPFDAATLAAPHGDAVSLSTDSGATWRDVPAPAGLASIAWDPARPGTLYAGGAAGVFRSSDRGATWEPLASGLPARGVTRVFTDGTGAALFARVDTSLWRLSLRCAAPCRGVGSSAAEGSPLPRR